MGNFVFQKATVRVDSFFNKIIQLMELAGWVNISSHSEDGYVMHSTGESGHREIYIQMEHKNPITGGQQYNTFMCRLRGKYIPGATGERGKFEKPWITDIYATEFSYVRNTYSVPLDTELTLYYYVDRNFIAYVSVLGKEFGHLACAGLLGISPHEYCDEHGTTGNLLAPHMTYGRYSAYQPLNNQALYNDTPLGNAGDNNYRVDYVGLMDEVIRDKYYVPVNLYLQNNYVGIRSKLPAFMFMSRSDLNNRFTSGDSFSTGRQQYRAFLLDTLYHTVSTNSRVCYPFDVIVIKIE